MTSRDFCYWLQGCFELHDGDVPDGAPPKPFAFTKKQTTIIRNHLALVFIHEIDPSAGPPEHQEKLDEAHAPTVQKTHAPMVQKPHAPYKPTTPSSPYGVKYRC